MKFRENLKKLSPIFLQKNIRKTKQKTTQTKTKQKTQQEKHKKQQQTKQAENCESVYWHTQTTGNFKGPRLSKKG